jgi:hypothetical protein
VIPLIMIAIPISPPSNNPSRNPLPNDRHPRRPPARDFTPNRNSGGDDPPGDPHRGRGGGNGGGDGPPPPPPPGDDPPPSGEQGDPQDPDNSRPNREPTQGRTLAGIRRVGPALRTSPYDAPNVPHLSVLPDSDFPGISALYFPDELPLWKNFLADLNRYRRGTESTTYGLAKSSATGKVRAALQQYRNAPEGKGHLAIAGVKAELNSTVVFSGKDSDPATFEAFVVKILEFLAISNLLGSSEHIDTTRVQFLGMRLRDDAAQWYEDHVAGAALEGSWTFIEPLRTSLSSLPPSITIRPPSKE